MDVFVCLLRLSGVRLTMQVFNVRLLSPLKEIPMMGQTLQNPA